MSSTASEPPRRAAARRLGAGGAEARRPPVTTPGLFLNLVFVSGLTEVTAFMADLTATGLASDRPPTGRSQPKCKTCVAVDLEASPVSLVLKRLGVVGRRAGGSAMSAAAVVAWCEDLGVRGNDMNPRSAADGSDWSAFVRVELGRRLLAW